MRICPVAAAVVAKDVEPRVNNLRLCKGAVNAA